MKICNITKNGRHHSLAHRTSKSSKRRSHTGRHRRIKRRISRIFRRRYKKHANPPQNSQSSNQAENTFRNFSFSRDDNISNNKELIPKFPRILDYNRETRNNNDEPNLVPYGLFSEVRKINENNICIHNTIIEPNHDFNPCPFNNDNIFRFWDGNSDYFSPIESTNNINRGERINEGNIYNIDNNHINNNTNINDINNNISSLLNTNINSEYNGNINQNNNVNHNTNDNDNVIAFNNYIDHSRLDNIRRRLRRLNRDLDGLIFNNYNPAGDNNILKSVKSNLRKIKYKDKNNKESKCAICIEDFKNGQNIYFLKCTHIFHVRCLNKEIRRRLKCPICRGIIE